MRLLDCVPKKQVVVAARRQRFNPHAWRSNADVRATVVIVHIEKIHGFSFADLPTSITYVAPPDKPCSFHGPGTSTIPG